MPIPGKIILISVMTCNCIYPSPDPTILNSVNLVPHIASRKEVWFILRTTVHRATIHANTISILEEDFKSRQAVWHRMISAANTSTAGFPSIPRKDLTFKRNFSALPSRT
jgi:hypothetical protein